MSVKLREACRIHPSTLGRQIGFVLALLLLPASSAHAYVDPGSGSVIVTTILGLLAAVGYTFRKYFYKVKRTFTGERQEDDDVGEA